MSGATPGSPIVEPGWVPILPPRGQGGFNPDRLRHALTLWKPGGVIAPPELADYDAFYGLQVAGISRRSLGYLPFEDGRLAVQLFEPEQSAGTAVICHGYFDHVGLFAPLVSYLLSRNLTVLAFDQPGHGLSSGPVATIDSFDTYVRALRTTLTAGASLPGPWYLLGQSMGGAVAMEHLITSRTNVRESGDYTATPATGYPIMQQALLLAPLVRPAYWPLNRIVYHLARPIITQRSRHFSINAANPEFLALNRKDPLQATHLPVQWVTAMIGWMERFEAYPASELRIHIIQGHLDRTVGWKNNLRILDRLAQTVVLHLPTGRHHLINESAVLRQIIWQWIDDQWGLAPANAGILVRR